MESQIQSPILQVRDLQVAYRQNGRSVGVLDRVSFDVRRGEILTLLGESGSGKSTIARAVSGLLPPSAQIIGGALRIDGTVYDRLGDASVPWERIRGREVGMIFQDAQQALHPTMKIKRQFAETLLHHKMATPSSVLSIAAKFLSMLRFADPERVLESYPYELSGGMCQRICLALALCLEPKVLVADEPTSALDTVSQREVLDLLRRSQEELGLSVLLITHDIAVASAVSDRVIVLHRGQVEEEGDAKTVLRAPRSAYTRQLLAARNLVVGAVPRKSPDSEREIVLEASGVTKRYGTQACVLRDANLAIAKGQIVGILGESGSGKSTLARCLAGLEPPDQGRVSYRGGTIHALRGKAKRRLCRHIQYVFQDARASLHPGRTAVELVQEPLHYMGIGNRKDRLETASMYLQAVGIRGEALHRRPPQLSTGQCQRIAIARALAPQPDVLLCDEPVSALDMNIQAQILTLLERLQRQFGFSLMIISHDTRVLRSFCHEIAVMEQGTITEVLPANRLQESERPYTRLLLACAGEIEGDWLRKGEENGDRQYFGYDRRDAVDFDTEQQQSERRSSLVEV